jgi:hypothetical protein
MEGLWNSVKGMFVKEDGSIKWASLVGIAAGAALGAYALPEMGVMVDMPVVAGVAGGLAGLIGGNLVGGMTEGGEAAPAPAANAGAGAVVAPPQRGVSQDVAPSFPGGKPPAQHGR